MRRDEREIEQMRRTHERGEKTEDERESYVLSLLC